MESDNNSFDGFIKFPRIKNINARTLADNIESVIPMQPKKIEKQYENHWGETVTKYKGGFFNHITSTGSHPMFGDRGHTFGVGLYIVNEDGQEIYEPSKEYNELSKKCSEYWEAMGILRSKYRLPEYSVERGRGDRLVVNDKIIKGISFYPGMRMVGSIESEIESIANFIQSDIDKGRIIKGKYGI